MKYVITGGAGNISKELALGLLKYGHDVTVIGRDETHLKALTDAGAKAAIGSLEDTVFLAKTFKGADAVYTMVPPNFNPTGNWKKWIAGIGNNYAAAIRSNDIKYVVNLSSIGAHLPDGCGPVSGLYKVEQALNASGAHVKHLRPGYFFANLMANIPLIKHMNIMGANFGGPDFKLNLSDPADIAVAAIEEMKGLSFNGKSVRYLSSDERSTDDIAAVIGNAIGKPALPWVVFSDEQSFQGMKDGGLSEEVAKNYVEMGKALREGRMQEDFQSHRPQFKGKVKLENFAKQFANAYESNSPH
jgi:uncharacterized protein YbjT (DUF2867 family)